MTVRQLRAILKRYGNAGVLFVGSYLLSHHVWQRRRWQALVAAGLLSALVVGILHRTAPVRKAHRKQAAVVPAPPPAALPLHLALQDDTTPVPFPTAEGDAPLRSEGTIFFSANFYHWSGQFYTYELSGDKEETLATDEAAHHLFRLTAGMARPRQLTFGEAEDRQPTLSPDGRQLAFIRQRDDRLALCLVSTTGGRVQTLLRLPHHLTAVQLSWSPDGRWFALLPDAYGEKKELLLFQVRSRTTIRLSAIEEAVWSSDGRLYLRGTDDHARIFQPDTRSSVPVKAVVCHAVWLDAHTLLGDSPRPEEGFRGSSRFLRLIDDQGQQIRELPLALIGKENEYTTFRDEHIWHRLPSHPSTALLETWRWMSDGEHHGCFRVDTRTGQARLVADGELMGIAPDGSRIAVAENDWVGPYKGGGERVGPLKIVSLATGRADSVTDPLSCIWEGIWQPAGAHVSRSHVAPLLEAVSRGDLPRTRALLARGADPDTAEPNGVTALMIAAADGRTPMVRLLLRHGARVDPVDRNGNTALLHAIDAEKMSNEVATSTQIAIAEMLLHAGAKVNASNHDGYTPLMLAAGEGRAVVADWLLKHGATPNPCSKWSQTALMLAASNGYSHTVQVLLDAHAAMNVKDKEGGTALDQATLSSHEDDPHTATITLLKQAGAIAQP